MLPWEGYNTSCLATGEGTTEKSDSKAAFENTTSVTQVGMLYPLSYKTATENLGQGSHGYTHQP